MRCCVNARKHRSQRLPLCDLRPLGLFEDAGQVPRQAGACQSLFFAPRRCDFDRGGRDVALSCLQTSVNVFQWREAFLVCAFDWRFACVLRACCLPFAGVVRGLCEGCAWVVRGVQACLRRDEATAAPVRHENVPAHGPVAPAPGRHHHHRHRRDLLEANCACGQHPRGHVRRSPGGHPVQCMSQPNERSRPAALQGWQARPMRSVGAWRGPTRVAERCLAGPGYGPDAPEGWHGPRRACTRRGCGVA
jgi:hypothetical protein